MKQLELRSAYFGGILQKLGELQELNQTILVIFQCCEAIGARVYVLGDTAEDVLLTPEDGIL